jgi:hypothetical protein
MCSVDVLNRKGNIKEEEKLCLGDCHRDKETKVQRIIGGQPPCMVIYLRGNKIISLSLCHCVRSI